MEIELLKRAIREVNQEWLESHSYDQASFFRETLGNLEEQLADLENY